jgi:putative membrane protein
MNDSTTTKRIMMKKYLAGITASMLFVAAGSFAQSPAPASSTAASSAPNDAQIAEIAVTANNVDIKNGKLAKSESKNKAVKDFAQEMITDHTGVNKKAEALVHKLKVKPEESADSKSMKDEGDAAMKKLKGLKGAEFDKAYIENEVTFHQQVLDALDKTLIPNAKNAELKNLLTTVRPVIANHLEHAKKIQASMK